MNHPQPFVREAGAGPGVVCLHSNASSSAQCRGLMDRLAPGFRVFAPDSYAAARSFIDYWMDEGSWERTPEARKPAIAVSVANVRRWAHALMTEPAPLDAFRALEMPVLYLTGKRSTRSAHGVARLLTRVLPNVEVLEFEQLGHMGPITDPQRVNEAIAAFLERARPGPR